MIAPPPAGTRVATRGGLAGTVVAMPDEGTTLAAMRLCVVRWATGVVTLCDAGDLDVVQAAPLAQVISLDGSPGRR